MRRLAAGVVVLAVVAMASQDAFAQRRGGGRGMMGNVIFLANQQSVQQELKLSDAQKKQADEQLQKIRGEFGSLQGLEGEALQQKMAEIAKSAEKAAAEFLQPDQLARLKQIALQQRGSRAFSSTEVADALKLTDEQKGKIKTIQEESRGQGGGNQGGQGGGRERMQAANKAATEKIVALLTPDQKTKWDEMVGKPFTGEITFPQRPQQ